MGIIISAIIVLFLSLFIIGVPANFNLWGEEEAQPFHLLRSNLIMDCRFRRRDHFAIIAYVTVPCCAVFFRNTEL